MSPSESAARRLRVQQRSAEIASVQCNSAPERSILTTASTARPQRSRHRKTVLELTRDRLAFARRRFPDLGRRRTAQKKQRCCGNPLKAPSLSASEIAGVMDRGLLRAPAGCSGIIARD
jgi:hypothetical protein